MQIISVTEFINTEHKQFTVYNSIRQIPMLIDGLKPSQRKLLFSTIEYGKIEIVERLAMWAAARTNYKAGGQNLSPALVNMAREYPGTNNVPYFDRDGQFGSVVTSKASSPRYISVTVSKVINKIFRKEDNDILDFNRLGNDVLEPKFYLPVVPMLLINGADGIGSGYATTIPNHSITSVIAALRALLAGTKVPPVQPAYNGYKGKVMYQDDGRVLCEGCFERINATTLRITEVPPGWYSKTYETKVIIPLYKGETLVEYSNDTSEGKWDITLNFKRGELSKLSDDAVMELLKLRRAEKPTLVAWNAEGYIDVYDSAQDILENFFAYRLTRYADRRQVMLDQQQSDIERLEMRAMFIQFMTAADLNQSVDTLKKLFQDEVKVPVDMDNLFKIPLSSITLDAKERLAREINKLKGTRAALLKKTAVDLYNEDLDDLESVL